MSEKMEKMVDLEEEEKGEELGVRLGPEQIMINQREFVDDEIACEGNGREVSRGAD